LRATFANFDVDVGPVRPVDLLTIPNVSRWPSLIKVTGFSPVQNQKLVVLLHRRKNLFFSTGYRNSRLKEWQQVIDPQMSPN
jgi:hypothetical protein